MTLQPGSGPWAAPSPTELPRRVAHVRGRQLSTLKWRSHHLTGSKDKEPGEERARGSR